MPVPEHRSLSEPEGRDDGPGRGASSRSDPSSGLGASRSATGYARLKRVIDALGAAFALVLLSWLLLPIMLALVLTGEHHVFYRQQRVGRGGGEFGIWKFATMLQDSPNLGTGSLTVRADPRVLPVGRLLRRTKLNELPQLINVIVGEMSFVGPRPQMRVDFDVYPDAAKAAIVRMTPGITGIGSVVFRDEEAFLSRPGIDPTTFYAAEIAPYKGALEEWYLGRRRLITDARLLWATGLAVLRPSSDFVFRAFPDLPARPAWWSG